MNQTANSSERGAGHKTPTPEQFRAIIDAAARYLQANEQRIRREDDPGFDAELLTQALVFHAVRRTVAIVWQNELPLGSAPAPGAAARAARAELDAASNTAREGACAPRMGALPGIAGIACAWQDFESRVRERDFRKQRQFQWQESDPAGDCIYFGSIITSHPAALKKLVQYFQERFAGSTRASRVPASAPDALDGASNSAREGACAPLKLLAHRRGRLVDDTGALERIANWPVRNSQTQKAI